MTTTRTIAVVTGTRAEFGLLQPVMHAIAHPRNPRPRKFPRKLRRSIGNSPLNRSQPTVKLRLQTIVTGTHLTTASWRDIERAGLAIAAKIPMQRADQSGRLADVVALGRGISALGQALDRLKPDVVLVLGDRIEALAAACAASVGGFYLAHIHGGDRASGVADEAMRHAISKLAHIHFPATTQSRNRLIRMGESPQYIFNTGSPAVDDVHHIQPAPNAPTLVVVQHPIGASTQQEKNWMQHTLRATAGYSRLILAPNADPGCQGIRQALVQARLPFVEHLPRHNFLSMLAGAGAIVGNSSAGLIEAAVLQKPAVNIGPRQDGREKPRNVVDCGYGLRAVQAAIRKALALNLTRLRHPYGNGHAGERIAEILSTIDLAQIPMRKANSY